LYVIANDRVTAVVSLTMRVGFPVFAVGVSFLL
jgi:hypothetical protein